MHRTVFLVGALLVALGSGLFLLKTFQYGIPMAPTENLGPWQVELRISARGDGGRGSVRALLPSTEGGQVIFDERSSSDRLQFSIRERGGNRIGVWTGWLEGVHEVVYQFHVQSHAVTTPLPAQGPYPEPPKRVRSVWGQPSPGLPSDAPPVKELLESLRLPTSADQPARIRTVYSFVTHEVATVPSAGGDALLTLARREGNGEGKERLLVTLLRAAGIPARLAHGLGLREGTAPEELLWVEAWVAEAWVPMSAVHDFFETLPDDYIVLGRSNVPVVEATGVSAIGHRFQSLREHLRPDEIANLLAPDNRLFAWLSLYRLPVTWQAVLRVLLLVPLGALVVATFRNLVGIKTYGTFMPVLIALALRGFPLYMGLLLVAAVIALGYLARFALERLRLLMVPRLSIMLCFVVLAVTAFALTGQDTGVSSLFAGALLPIVILTMLIERVYITTSEEGYREALMRSFWSVLVASAIHPIFRSEYAEYLMFSFPELVIVVMGLLVWIGGYMGYRIVDLIRFRDLVRGDAAGGAAR
jgi:7 transmembrane helices usually fused to an inactive transglutaminase/Transglutaminase-like superfamily/Inactive transglutaminase fused to 7 transmembrane helices